MAGDKGRACRTAKDRGKTLVVAKRMARVLAKDLARELDAIEKGKAKEFE
jgi:hypothetical protein